MLNCDSSAVLRLVLMVKQIMSIIRVVVPVLLVVMCMVDVARLMASNMEKNSDTWKKVGNRILAAVVFFLVPTITNFVMQSVEVGNLTDSDCWTNANNEYIAKLRADEDARDDNDEDSATSENKKADKEWREKQLAIRNELGLISEELGNSEGNILIIAGHGGGDPGAVGNGYKEHDLAVEVAVGVQKSLDSLGVKSVIANKVLDENMNVNILKNREKLAAAVNLSQFERVFEIHFNAGGGDGAEVYVSNINNPSEFDKTLMNNVEPLLKRHGSGFLNSASVGHLQNKPLGNYTFFAVNNKLKFSLFEVAFIDKKTSLDRYLNNKQAIYDAIANALKAGG